MPFDREDSEVQIGALRRELEKKIAKKEDFGLIFKGEYLSFNGFYLLFLNYRLSEG